MIVLHRKGNRGTLPLTSPRSSTKLQASLCSLSASTDGLRLPLVSLSMECKQSKLDMNRVGTISVQEAVMLKAASVDAVLSFQHPYWKKEYFKKVAKYP